MRCRRQQLSSQYDSDHLKASQYFGRVIIFRKDIIIFVRENKLKSDSNFLLSGIKDVMYLGFCVF